MITMKDKLSLRPRISQSITHPFLKDEKAREWMSKCKINYGIDLYRSVPWHTDYRLSLYSQMMQVVQYVV